MAGPKVSSLSVVFERDIAYVAPSHTRGNDCAKIWRTGPVDTRVRSGNESNRLCTRVPFASYRCCYRIVIPFEDGLALNMADCHNRAEYVLRSLVVL